jgi:hypothetical protein
MESKQKEKLAIYLTSFFAFASVGLDLYFGFDWARRSTISKVADFVVLFAAILSVIWFFRIKRSKSNPKG